MTEPRTFSQWALEVARCFTTGLILEAAAYPKPGLVDRVNPLRELDIFRFSASATSLYPHFAKAAAMGRRGRTSGTLGRLVFEAVRETLRVQAGGNTHLGAVLLTIPLAAAAGSLDGRIVARDLRRAAVTVVKGLGALDTIHIFKAIEYARPGGLGRVPFLDVTSQETYEYLRRHRVGLLEALEPYRGRDMVADELIGGYPLVFDVSLKRLVGWREEASSFEKACVNALLAVMACRPDTHIVRRRGVGVARIAQSMAETALGLGGASTSEGLEAVLELDGYLRRIDARPGSSADVLAASIGVTLLLGCRV
ncbi:2-(5''-triphosphoribosyl)-3'-dephosphocoenzyme-A synthase [Candidatus Calditenuaceae archaeon HR02]|nr:2-(5''-triphosphoribosyl)-3'-dephosphocoenzyme-A synthase [Candidatus Calditenuaceae archaeon HR02]